MKIVDREKVKSVKWTGDPIKYDLDLYSLGRKYDEFLIPNPNIGIDLDQIIKKIPQTNRCVVWYYEDQWIAKKFNNKWRPEYGYYDISVSRENFKFNFLWIRNPAIPEGVVYEYDPYRNYNVSLDEAYYELVWYIDPRFDPAGDKIWVVKCKNQNQPCLGTKDMGYLTPKVHVIYNEKYKDLNINIDSLYPAYNELEYENIHKLEKSFIPYNDKNNDEWVIKFIPKSIEPKSVVVKGDAIPTEEIIYNDFLPNLSYELEYSIPYWDLQYTHVWMLSNQHCENAVEDIWAIKIRFCKNPIGEKIVGEISPQYIIELNDELPKLDYDIDYDVPYHDFEYEHVWMLDNEHCENAVEDIWAVKIRYIDNPIGTKIIGSVSPLLKIDYNEDLPPLSYDIDYAIPYHDLGYEHVWMLDKNHTRNLSEEIWAVKISPTDEPVGTKIVDYISPTPFIECNKDVKGYNFNLPSIDVQYHDLQYSHVWMLDKKFSGNFDIWAIKISYVKKTKKQKYIGDISPLQKIQYNREIKDVRISINYNIPYHDRFYEHIWYLDEKFSNGEKIWAARLLACDNPIGEKEAGTVVPQIAETLDVIFISYNQLNAEENWQRVLEKAPYAKRVENVKGIFNAHKQAAEIAETDMFYVVDGDAYLVDDWNFDFQPSIFDRECCYVWSSKNSLNDLVYQNGGVKLFSKKVLLSQTKWETLDMTTGIMPKLKSEERISCVNKFNTDPFTTWRSSFRECVKLYTTNQIHKLNIWSTKGKNKKFGRYSVEAAIEAQKFAKKNLNNQKELLKINDYEWLEKQFKKIYKNELRKT